MCTLTAVPNAAGVRVAFNRDELRSRPTALPPVIWRNANRTVIHPTDPASGGTWLAVTYSGLVLAILNVNGNGVIGPSRVSRGTVIQAALSADSPWGAVNGVERGLELSAIAPFRLVVLSRDLVADLVWDGQRAVISTQLLGRGPVMFTSSGLGDYLVEQVRRELFVAHFAIPSIKWTNAQDGFHRHRWTERPEMSVNMCRPDARTVSHAIVEIGRTAARFVYHPDAPDRPANDTVIELALGKGL